MKQQRTEEEEVSIEMFIIGADELEGMDPILFSGRPNVSLIMVGMTNHSWLYYGSDSRYLHQTLM